MAITARNLGGDSATYNEGISREDLADFIEMISPEETVGLAMAPVNSASNTAHAWTVDSYRDVNPQNAQADSFEYGDLSDSTLTTKKLYNYCQLRGAQVNVGKRGYSTNNVSKDEFMRQVNKAKVEINQDVEAKWWLYNDFTVDGSVVYDTGASSKQAGVAAYAGIVTRAANTGIELNSSAGTGTAITSAQGVATSILDTTNAVSGTHVPQYTASPTDVQLTLDHLNSTFEQIKINGGRVDTLMVPVTMKGRVSQLLAGPSGAQAPRRSEALENKIRIGIDEFITDFGDTVAVVPNWMMNQTQLGSAASTVFAYERSMVKRTILTPYDFDADGTGRHGKAGILSCDETMEVKAPNKVGMIIGVKATA